MTEQEKLALTVSASNVFTPGAPIDRQHLFAGRRSQVSDVINATVQPGRHVIMFGERGVGKTSLAKVISEILATAGHKLLDSGTINCDGTDDFSSIWHKVFRELTYIMESKQSAGFVNGSTNDHGSRVSLERLLPESARPDDVRYVLNRLPEPSIIIIDEVDRIRDKETTTLLADTIKNLSDHAVKTTLVLVGVADSVEQLIAEHKSIERALVQVPMPRMSNAELIQIIDRRLSLINMTIEDNAKGWITELSKGLPYYTHSLSLHAAHAAIKDDRINIGLLDVAEATHNTVAQAHTILSAYNKAVTSPQKQNLYEQVLLSCALTLTDELGYFSAGAVKRPMSAIMGRPYDVPSFARHLSDFCTDERGPILHKIGYPRRFRYRFADPMMEPFVIIHGYSSGRLNSSITNRAYGLEE